MSLHINLYVLLILLIITLLGVINTLMAKINQTKNQHNDISDYVSSIINTINSVRYGNLIARLDRHPNKDLNEVSKCINRMIETLNDREKMIIEYQGELKRKNDFLKVIINSLSDCILVLDENYRIIQYTENINQWFGEGKKYLNSSILKHIKISNEKEINGLNEDEIFIENSNDKRYTATVTKLNSEEHSNNYLMIIKDVTNQKEIETLKEDFVATLTHDLKVPIIAESNMLNFLLSEKFGALNEKQREAIENMQNSNKELLELVHIVLDTYKLKDSGIELYKQPVVLSRLINEVTQEMQPIADVTKNSLIIKIKEDNELLLDKMQMKRVLKNLIQNAILYGKSNSDIEIKLSAKDKNALIKVKDYGKGIPKEDIAKVFNKYFSANKKFRKIGTGLGLYLSKAIVEAHDGTLVVQSEENKYTEFCITLPL